jgi:hypothetical protein
MKRLLLLTGLLFIIFFANAAKPGIKKIEVNPETVKIGQKVTFTLTFSGKKEDIKLVKLYNVEFPNDAPVIELQPETGAAGNVWKAIGPVPEYAPIGVYTWEIKVTDRKDKEVIDKKYSNQLLGKAGKLSFEVVP